MKMDGCQSKGVAGGAFCKRLKRNEMDDGKLRRLEQSQSRKREREGYTPVVTGKSAKAFDSKRVVECCCAMRRRKNSKPHDSKRVVERCWAAGRSKSLKTIEKKRARYGPWLWGGCQGLKTDGVLKARQRANSRR
jgi:hypothetical protein